MKRLAFLVPALIIFALLFGCPAPDNGGGTTVANTAICPSTLQACGAGCIPTNAICCDDGVQNAYCLQPTNACGEGSCFECDEGQVFCGMFCKPIGEECCIGDSCGAEEETNPYVGTWEFKGNYHYHVDRDCEGRPESDNTGEVTGTLTIRAVFIPKPKDPEPGSTFNFWDQHTVWVSNLWADDPDFETGADGVAPVLHDTRNDLSGSEMTLPLLPRDPADPENYGIIEKSSVNPDGRRYDPLSKHAFAFYFPNSSEDKWGTAVSFGEGLSGEAHFTMNEDGTEFASIEYTAPDPFMVNDTWDARAATGFGPLSSSSCCGAQRDVFCGPRFESWTAKKISD